LQVFDVSVPWVPVLTGSYDMPQSAYRVAVLGTLAYVADEVAGLQILRVLPVSVYESS
ncbi:MAG: hypothetical protein GY720_06380, partial [bacterium]|nr:hypothetical protein [bacterium]